MEYLQNAKYMKQNILTLVCLLLIGSIAPTFATASDADPCEEYQQNVTMSVDVFGSYMYYYVSYNGIRPHVDSVWIENENDSIVLTSHAQSGDMIDISSLGDGTYSFHAQIGNCVVTESIVITCADYRHITLAVIVYANGTIRYDVSNNGKITPPYVDSVWITNTANKSVVFTGHAQSKETIDISFLTRGYYALWIQMGDCVMGRVFTIRWNGVSTSCKEYRHINVITKENEERSAMYYDLSNNGTITPPHVDSVWITTPDTSVMLISHAQSGEWIDISSLKYENYYLWIQIGDCVLSKQFVITPPDPCIAYRNTTIAVTVAEDYSTIRYDLTDDGMPIALSVDSMWITNNAVSPVVLTGHAQPGEPIDISFLRKGLYVLWVQIEGCVKEGPQFRIDRISTDLDSPADSGTAVKILHNGQLLILRNNKVYTLQGVETRL